MIDPLKSLFVEVCISELPYVQIDRRQQLPSLPGIYFCLAKKKVPVYIGQTRNLLNRLTSSCHEKLDLCKKLGAIEIVYWDTSSVPEFVDDFYRREIEKILISLCRPVLNTQIPANRHLTTLQKLEWIERLCS